MDAEELSALIESHSAAIRKLHSEATSLNSEIASLHEKHKESENKEESQAEINEAIKRRQVVLEQFVEHSTERAELQRQADPARNSPRPNEDIAAMRIIAAQADLKAKREARAKAPEAEEPSTEASTTPTEAPSPSPSVASAPAPPLPSPSSPSISSVLAPDLSAITKAKSTGGKQHFDVTGKDATGTIKTVSVTTAKNRDDAHRIARLHGLSGMLVAERNKKSERAAARAARTGSSSPTDTRPTGTEEAPTGTPPPVSGKVDAGGTGGRGSGPSTGLLDAPDRIIQVHDAQMFVLVTQIHEKMEKAKTEDDKKEGEAKREDDTKGKTKTEEEVRTETRKKRGHYWRKNKELGGTREDKKIGGSVEERRARRLGKLHSKKKFGARLATGAKRAVKNAPSTAGGLIGAGGMELAAAAGPIGEFAAAVVAFGVVVYEFARHQEKEIRRQAQFGAPQAAGIAHLDVHRQLRDIQTAKETSGTSTGLLESLDRLEEVLRPLESILQNLENAVGSGLLDTITLSLAPLAAIAQVLTNIFNKMPGAKRGDEDTNWNKLVKLANETKDKGFPAKFPGL